MGHETLVISFCIDFNMQSYGETNLKKRTEIIQFQITRNLVLILENLLKMIPKISKEKVTTV